MRSPELKTTTTLLLILLLSFSILPITTTQAEEIPDKAVTWNFSSTTEGWTGRNATARHSPDGGGRLYLDTFGNDPGVVSPNLSITASSNDLLRMYIWSYCSDRDCHIYFKRSGSSTTFYGGYVYLSQGSAGGTYEVDMSGVADWTGTITQIRIDPSDYCGSAGTPGFIAFDWITTSNAPDPTITLTSPNGGQVWDVGTSQSITWSSENVTSNVLIQLYVNGTADRLITAGTSNDGSYTWSTALPNNGLASNDCTIGISAMSGTVYDFSNSDFAIRPQSFTATEPNGGEQWGIGDTERIEWTNPGGYANFALQVSRNGGSSWSTIESGLPGNYYYRDWTVTGYESATCRIRVIGNYDGGSRYDDSSGYFAIIDQTPWIQVTDPNGGETIYMGHDFPVTWSSDNLTTTVAIHLYTDGSNHVVTHEAGTVDDGYQMCAMPFSLSEGCNYSIATSANSGSVYDFSDSYFCVAKPSITPVAPAGGGSYMQGDALTIEWTDDHVLGDVRLEAYIEDQAYPEWLNHTTTNDGHHIWTIPAGFPDSHYVKIGFSAMSHEVWNFTETFTIGNPPEPDYPEAIYFSQLDANWADDQMGTCADDMGLSGCAVTCTAMLMNWENGSYDDPDPGELNAWLGSHSGYTGGCLINWLVAEDYDGEGVGLEYVESVNLSTDDWAALDAELSVADRMPVVLVDYSTGSDAMSTHFVVVYDRVGAVDDPSSYLILDPMETSFSSTHSLAHYTNSINGRTIFGLRKFSGSFPVVEPVLELTAPVGGEIWTAGQTYDITWYDEEIDGTIQIQPYLNGEPQANIAGGAPNTGIFSWTIPTETEESDTWKVRISAHGGTIWDCSGELTIESDLTDVDDMVTPARLVFHPPTPNPFNPRTTFRFGLPERDHVRLEIYDVQGRRIAALADRSYGPGTYSIAWNGRDDQGASVPAGVYFGRLVVGSDSKTQSVVLIK
jgi:hypothetical protein